MKSMDKSKVNKREATYNMKTENTLYPIKQNGKYGYINNKGEITIEAKFEYAEEFIGELALISIGEKVAFIDKQGDIISKVEYDDVYEMTWRWSK